MQLELISQKKRKINYEIEYPFVECYTDGATVGWNGKLGTVSEVGVGVFCQEREIYHTEKMRGISNNEAEFKALICAMKLLLERGEENVQFYLDSRIVVNRAMRPYVKKTKKLKDPTVRMNNFQQKVLDLAEQFNSVHFKWIPREENTVADELSKQSI